VRKAERSQCSDPASVRLGLFDEQGDVVVVSIIDVEKRGGESASAFRTNAGATREPIARCARLQVAQAAARRPRGRVLVLAFGSGEASHAAGSAWRVVQSRASVFACRRRVKTGPPAPVEMWAT
jgi:hypothetical protein